jgi:hypothetical protein
MKQADRRLVRGMVREDIGKAVARAAQGSGFLRAGEQAYRIAKAYPNCGMANTEIVNEIIAACAAAGVAVEIYEATPVAA